MAVRDDGSAAMPNPVVIERRDTHKTYAIAAFLLALGTISLFFSRLDHLPSAATVACVLALLWSARLGLELAYPVEVSLFHLLRPSGLILPVIAVMAALYAISVLANCSTLLRKTR